MRIKLLVFYRLHVCVCVGLCCVVQTTMSKNEYLRTAEELQAQMQLCKRLQDRLAQVGHSEPSAGSQAGAAPALEFIGFGNVSPECCRPQLVASRYDLLHSTKRPGCLIRELCERQLTEDRSNRASRCVSIPMRSCAGCGVTGTVPH